MRWDVVLTRAIMPCGFVRSCAKRPIGLQVFVAVLGIVHSVPFTMRVAQQNLP